MGIEFQRTGKVPEFGTFLGGMWQLCHGNLDGDLDIVAEMVGEML